MAAEPDLPRVYLGVDAGGTKTLALLAGAEGDVIGRGESGPGNLQAAGQEAAWSALETAIGAARRAAGLADSAPLAGACLGMAGVDRPADRALMREWAARQFGPAPVVIANDAQIVLAAGTPDGAGVAVISGTGSMIYAEDARGNTARAGGWGYLIGDEGSGYAVGLAGLRAVARAHDGRGEPTLLTARVLAALGIAGPTGLVEKLYRSAMTRAEIAQLALLVEQAAAEDDPPALEIIAQAADELAIAARAVARKLSLPEPAPCALAGGMLTRGRLLGEAFRRAVEKGGPKLSPLTLVEEPALGAVKLAMRAGMGT